MRHALRSTNVLSFCHYAGNGEISESQAISLHFPYMALKGDVITDCSVCPPGMILSCT